MELPNFRLDIDEETNSLGIEEVSYVEYPATGLGYLAFSEKEVQKNFAKMTFEADEMMRMTSGVLMMPDTKYLRVDANNNYYTVEFSAETLKEALIKYLKEDKQNVVKVEHSGDSLESFRAIEHWIITNPNTKSPIFKFSLEDLGYDPLTIPIGTIMKTTYVADEMFWNDYILTGKVKGYSLGGMFEMIPVEVQTFLEQKEKESKKDVEVVLNFLKTSNSIIKTKNNIDLQFKDDKVYSNDVEVDGHFEFSNGLKIVVKQGYIVDSGFVSNKNEDFSLKSENILEKNENETISVIDNVIENVEEFSNEISKEKFQTIIEENTLLKSQMTHLKEEMLEITKNNFSNEKESELLKVIEEQEKSLNEFVDKLANTEFELDGLKELHEKMVEEFKKEKELELKNQPIKRVNNETKPVSTNLNNFVELKVGNTTIKVPKNK
jgi:hypothetical protein